LKSVLEIAEFDELIYFEEILPPRDFFRLDGESEVVGDVGDLTVPDLGFGASCAFLVIEDFSGKLFVEA
jgi:hypothetical protein